VVVASGTPGDCVLPPVIAAFHLQHPGVELKIRGWSANRLISIVRSVVVPLTPAAEQNVRLLRERYPADGRR